MRGEGGKEAFPKAYVIQYSVFTKRFLNGSIYLLSVFKCLLSEVVFKLYSKSIKTKSNAFRGLLFILIWLLIFSF